MVNCPYCGKLTDPKLENCPHCGGYLMKGLAPFTKPPSTERAPHQTCPNCHALVKEGDIICVACGTNLLTGQKIAEEGKKEKAPGARRRVLLIVGAAAAALLVVAAVGVLLYSLSKDPLQKAAQNAAAGDFLEAGNILTAHLQKKPDDAKAHFLHGKVLWKMNQFQQAADAFERAAESNPQNIDAAMLAVIAMGAAGESAHQAQIARLRKVTAKFPDNEDAWYLLALILGSSGDVQGQIEALKNTAGASPSVHRAKGIALALQGNDQEAQQELLTAAESEGDGGDMAAAIGFAGCLAGKIEQGEQRLKQALDTGTTVPNMVLLRLGLVLVQQGRFDEAEQYLARILAENRNEPTAQYYHAICLQARGLNEEALREYNAVAQQAKNPFANEAAIRAAEMQLAQNNTAPARDLIEKNISAGGNSPALHVLRGRAMLQAGEDARARESFKRAMELDPNYAPAYLENALMYIKQQLFAEAVRQLEKYLSIAPAGAPAARADEVNMLLDQLRQATGRTGLETAGTAAVNTRSM